MCGVIGPPCNYFNASHPNLSLDCRLKNEEGVVHLVSTWPFPVLNLNEIEIPFGDYLVRETPRSECIADLIVKGLFYRKVKFCRLQMLVLPKDTREGGLCQFYLRGIE